MIDLPAAVLKPGRDDACRRFHPWIFSGAIAQIRGSAGEGDDIEVFSHDGAYLATGHYLGGSIAIKIYSFERIRPGHAFWLSRLKAALSLRESLGLTGDPRNTAFRLAAAEGDFLPGLIIDLYDTTAVLQTHTLGMHRIRNTLAECLVELLGSGLEAVYDKSSEVLERMTGRKSEDGWLHGKSADIVIMENGCSYLIDIEGGQKTGFYLDQRENRRLVGEYARGRRVLNLYCYTGGFSIQALKAGAREVHSVDSSRPALEMADRNVALNGFDPSLHRSIQADVREYLERADDDCDLVILDPPPFARNKDSRHRALTAYRHINRQALRGIAPGGLLFTFSCSQVVDRQLFESTVLSAAIESGRRVRILQHLSQPPDHPTNAFHPEGEYLKGLVLHVE